MQKTDVISKKETAVAVPSYIKQDSNRGNENVTMEDIQLPRIDVLQALSPQLDKKKDAFIEGAEQGMLFNTLTGELYGPMVRIVPVSFVIRYMVWVNRKINKDGGLRGIFDTLAEADVFKEQQEDATALEISPTAEHLVLLEDGSEVIISMAKSKIKISRKFNALIRLHGGDRFSGMYMLTTQEDSSPQGEFKNFLIMPKVEYPTEEVYNKASAMYEEIARGARQTSANYDDQNEKEVEETTAY